MREVEQPERIAVSPDGDTAAFVVPLRADGSSEATGLWCGRLDGVPRRVSELVPDTFPVFSPDGTRLAFGVQEDEGSRIEILTANGEPVDGGPQLSLPGYVEALSWSASGLLALAAEPGADSAAVSSGRPLPSADADPRVVEVSGWRRVWRIDPAGGPPDPVTPPGLTVWEFAPVPGGGQVVIGSEDPREDGWYRAVLAHVSDDPAASPRILYRSAWQLSTPTVDPDGEQVAFVEGWASDRGLLAGEIRILSLGQPEETPQTIDAGVDVTWLSWDAAGRLWLAGWDHLDTAWGWWDSARADGGAVVHRRQAECVNSRWHPAVAPLSDDRALTARSSPRDAPEVVHVRAGGEARRWSTLNDAAGERPMTVRDLRWRGDGDLEIEGLLALPASPASAPPPLVVDIHGGPSLLWSFAWSMTWAEVLTEAGFAVLMPNYRGSAGRGQAFARRNHRDPGGAELDDVIAGVRQCAADGLIDERRVGAIGASYGGYLTAWAMCRPKVFAAGVVIAGVTDLLSSRGTANNSAFYDFLLGGAPATTDGLYLNRSPVVAVDRTSAPTLILHGEQDTCVPVGQAYELHHSLRTADVETELVIYPREGHQMKEPAHVDDARRRAVSWFTGHLLG